MAERPGIHIGLTGGIGSGKSTVAGMLRALGATLIDADAISRSLTGPGGMALDTVRSAFGPDVIDTQGGMDRIRMRELIFADATAKQRLEAILHPMIGAETQRQLQAAMGQTVVHDIPLLVESGRWRTHIDRVLVVDCSEAVQVARVMQRSGWTRDTVLSVMAQQASRQARLAAADAVLFNDGLGLHQLAQEVSALWQHWHRVEQSARSSKAPSP